MDEIICNQSFCAENQESKLAAAEKLLIITALQGREYKKKGLLYRNRLLAPQTSNSFCKH